VDTPQKSQDFTKPWSELTPQEQEDRMRALVQNRLYDEVAPSTPIVDRNTPTIMEERQANERQVGGAHYRTSMQHWDYVWVNDLDYFQGQITKYVSRWKKKGGLQDLEKAKHFLDKYMELIRKEHEGCEPTDNGYVDQDRQS